jgi:Ser/Thr protein kinase RdoA (MazF antagonist)
MSNQDGLEWVTTSFGLKPRWTKEPNIEAMSKIARIHLGHHEDVPMDVAFYAQGAFNKLYKISAAGSVCLMRVSLPVYPRLKTQSEVATINFVRRETDMPVPRIIAFDSESQNELGFEWIMMEMMPGVPLRKRWRKMTWKPKETIVRQLVHYQAQLFSKTFPNTGNLCLLGNGNVNSDLGPIVSLMFFWGNHLTHSVARGPFKNSQEWLQARLQFALADQQHILSTSDDEDDIEDAEFAKDLAEEIEKELPNVFPPEADGDYCNIIFHDDLSMQNILVDEEGKLTAIVDWECVSAVPLWRACQIPQLLEGRSRDEEPTRDQYMTASDGEEEEADADALDNEGVNQLFWEHRMDYEQTQLRKVFMDEMKIVCPDWLAMMKSSTLKADMEKAVHNCDNSWAFKLVKRWFTAYKEGNLESLTEKMMA